MTKKIEILLKSAVTEDIILAGFLLQKMPVYKVKEILHKIFQSNINESAEKNYSFCSIRCVFNFIGSWEIFQLSKTYYLHIGNVDIWIKKGHSIPHISKYNLYEKKFTKNRKVNKK